MLDPGVESSRRGAALGVRVEWPCLNVGDCYILPVNPLVHTDDYRHHLESPGSRTTHQPGRWPQACTCDHTPEAGCPLEAPQGRCHDDRKVVEALGRSWMARGICHSHIVHCQRLWDSQYLIFPLKGKVFSANSQSGKFDSGKRWVEYGFLALDPWYRAVHGFREGLTLIEPGCSQDTSRHKEDTNQIEASFSLLFLGFIFQQVFSYLGHTERANTLESVRLALCILQLSVPLQELLELCLLGLKWLPLKAWKVRVSVLGIYLWLSWPAGWAFVLIHLFSSFHTPTWVHTHMGVSTHSHYMSTHSTKYTLH